VGVEGTQKGTRKMLIIAENSYIFIAFLTNKKNLVPDQVIDRQPAQNSFN
jgi:hypothetical protein